MVPSQTFPIAALPRDPVCWAVHGVSSAVKLAGDSNQLILVVPSHCVDEKKAKSSAFGCQCLAIMLPAGAGLSMETKSTSHPVKLGLCGWHSGCDSKCWSVPVPGHTRAAHGLPESYSSLQIKAIICVSNLSFLIESNTSNV